MIVAQLCPTLCDPMDCSPPGSSVHGIVQARILKWVAIFLGLQYMDFWRTKTFSPQHLGTPFSLVSSLAGGRGSGVMIPVASWLLLRRTSLLKRTLNQTITINPYLKCVS